MLSRVFGISVFLAFLIYAGFGSPGKASARLVGQVAPELGNQTWIHSDPLRLKDLRGKVVLLEFWTYG